MQFSLPPVVMDGWSCVSSFMDRGPLSCVSSFMDRGPLYVVNPPPCGHGWVVLCKQFHGWGSIILCK